mgnify:CR=1 FL=1
MSRKKIIIAVPRGRIIEDCKTILNQTSFSPDPLLFDDKCRRLTFSSSDSEINFIKVRAFDVCTFVAFGAAQIGIAGDDVVQEFDYSEVYAPLDLKIGRCRLSVAAPKTFLKEEGYDAKFGKWTYRYWNHKGYRYWIVDTFDGIPSGNAAINRALENAPRIEST